LAARITGLSETDRALTAELWTNGLRH
jgi:hypothetical protein